ncbi:MAG: hypothetical protein ACJAYU_001962 [Bradymonadia bacterium]|jgi:hypothetical protein
MITAAALPLLVTASASAQYDIETTESAVEHDIFRVDLAARFTSRTFDLTGPSEVLFDAPYYPGLSLDIAVFPVAIFALDSPAAGIGLGLTTTKHVLNTVAAYEVGDETFEFDVPTRHDVTRFAFFYEWKVSESVTVIPELALHTVEVGLGYNQLYRNSFYRSVDIGAGVNVAVGPSGLSMLLDFGFRPAVDLGSTVEPFGKTASSIGLAAEGGLLYRSSIGIYGEAVVAYDRYSTTYRPDRNEDRDDSKATDQFQSFVFSLGYAY